MTIGTPETKPHPLDAHIHALEASIKTKPKEVKFHAALGALYMRRNDKAQNDITNALVCFNKAIEINPKHKDAVIAYSSRGKFYVIQKLYDRALEDLNKAKEFFGQISKQQQQEIEHNINLAQQALSQSASLTTVIPKMKSGGANAPVHIPDEKFYNLLRNDEKLSNVAPTTTLFFAQLLHFLNKKMDSQVNAMPNSGSELYWKALALCTKALNQEKEYGMTSFIRGLYFQAKETFEQLLGQYTLAKKSPPSMIHYVAATVYFKLESLEESLEQLNLAIIGNPDGDVTYYRFRALLNQQLGNDDAAKADEQMALKIDSNPPYYKMVNSAYNEVSHCIEFYDQVILDNKNYYIPESIYESLANMGVNLIPKRGKELESIEFLYVKRAMLNAIMGRTHPEKLEQSISDASIALSKIPVEDPTYLKVLIGRAQVHYYMKNYEEAVQDFNTAIEMVPKYSEFYFQRAQVHYKMDNYKAALADLEVASTLAPERPEEIKKMKLVVETAIEKLT